LRRLFAGSYSIFIRGALATANVVGQSILNRSGGMAMRRLIRATKAGEWPAREAIGRVTLNFDDRCRPRLRLITDQGEPMLLDLARAVPLADGAGLGLEGDAGWVRVRAAEEDVPNLAT
jgi:urease accessory protein UreE